jgi:type I restriction enzyme S subunit
MKHKNSISRLEGHGVTSVPEKWIQSRVKYLGVYINGYPFKPEDWGSVGRPILRIQNLTSNEHEPNRFDGEIPLRYLVRAGDILISWSASLGVFRWAGEESWLNQHIFKVVLDEETVGNEFFMWLAEWFITEMAREVHGSTMQHLTADAFGGFPVLLPPRPEQDSIAAYLGRKATRLDGLVAAKERLLALFVEKRRALISRAVTRGLNRNIPLRDSGIPWLGQIPAHWQVERAKWLLTERDERSVTGEETLLSLRMEIGLVRHNDVSEKTTRSEELIGYKKTSTNEIVVNRMRAASGLVAVTPQEGLVSPDYAVFRTGPRVDPHFFTHLFKTDLMQAVFRSESTGLGTGSSGFLRLYSENFLDLLLPVPPLSEQQAIVEQITAEIASLDGLCAATERTIVLLKERRAAMISAAVTGLVEVEAST